MENTINVIADLQSIADESKRVMESADDFASGFGAVLEKLPEGIKVAVSTAKSGAITLTFRSQENKETAKATFRCRS